MKITKEWIMSHDACSAGAKWGIKTVGMGLEWDKLLPKFRRADWLIWAMIRTGLYSHRQVVWLACVCAKQALRFLPADELRPDRAIIAAERWIAAPGPDTASAANAAASAANAAANAAVYAAAREKEHLALCRFIRAEMKTERFKALGV